VPPDDELVVAPPSPADVDVPPAPLVDDGELLDVEQATAPQTSAMTGATCEKFVRRMREF
jgi:hypothetical protein